MKKEFRIEIEERAKIEISEAFEWYENQQVGLGVTFIEALQNAFKTIQKSPNGYTKYRYHRQFPLSVFPYVVLYEIVKETMYVDAVFHTRRNPMDKIR
jgi:plasmid stabilization system protein ParE